MWDYAVNLGGLGSILGRPTWSVTDTGAGVEACSVRLDGSPRFLVQCDSAFTFANVADGPHQATVSCEDRVDRSL